eukprot:TRINITY_DN1348_c0_g1_i1.p1 TRINITY_DN1348_c0_g1~~TRINITY_DN1348_c0_g1_i1.p1  ORF type:complete len:137 (-),score=58.40 TRINITY_DN1348_c0_g1_i1:176-586(-)
MLRMAMRRLAVPLGRDGAAAKALKEAGQNAKTSVEAGIKEVRGFEFGKFFEEKHFWSKANVGPVFLLLFLTPTLYRSFKDAYWTRQLRKLDTAEIISDRYEWLRLNMLQDEVEAALLKKVPAGGVEPLTLGPATPP